LSRYFLIVLLFLFSVSLKAQSYFNTHSSDLKDSAVNVYIPPPAKVLSNLQKAINPNNPFRLTFVGVEKVDYPEGAKAAADFATNLISSYINFNSLASGDSIRIKVVWQEIASTNIKLASTLTSKNLLLQNNVSYLYPTPLAEKKNGNMNGTEYDATITVYKINGIERYYFGTDGQCPSTQIDFVTIFLHEITHALGFGSSIYLYNGDATFGFDSLGNVKANGARGFPMFYDTFVVDSNAFKTKLIEDTQYNFTNYIKSDKIYFESANSKLFNNSPYAKP